METATFRFVAQCLNQPRHRVPLSYFTEMFQIPGGFSFHMQ
jgi:hypothetical protein